MPENTNQPELKIAEDLDLFQQEWKGMPEFVMTPEKPFRTIKLHFKTKEAVEQFQQLFDQKIHDNYENYWFPKLNRKAFSEEFYTDAT
jgi:hypothetical protein